MGQNQHNPEAAKKTFSDILNSSFSKETVRGGLDVAGISAFMDLLGVLPETRASRGSEKLLKWMGPRPESEYNTPSAGDASMFSVGPLAKIVKYPRGFQALKHGSVPGVKEDFPEVDMSELQNWKDWIDMEHPINSMNTERTPSGLGQIGHRELAQSHINTDNTPRNNPTWTNSPRRDRADLGVDYPERGRLEERYWELRNLRELHNDFSSDFDSVEANRLDEQLRELELALGIPL